VIHNKNHVGWLKDTAVSNCRTSNCASIPIFTVIAEYVCEINEVVETFRTLQGNEELSQLAEATCDCAPDLPTAALLLPATLRILASLVAKEVPATPSDPGQA
jgi:hypothetical protein